MISDSTILLILLFFIFFITLLICFYFLYLEEKRKCKHRWEEVDRRMWTNSFGGDFIKVELSCKLCGEVEFRNSYQIKKWRIKNNGTRNCRFSL